MKNTIIATSVLFVAVVVAAIFYFTNLRQGDQSKRKPFTLIPEDAVSIVSFRNDESLDDIFAEFELFQAILGDEQFTRLTYIRKVILEHEQIRPYAQGQEILLSFHPSTTHIDYLMVLPSNEKLTTKSLYEKVGSIDTSFAVQWIDTLQQPVFGLQMPNDMPMLFVTQQRGVILASFSMDLVNRAINETAPKLTDEAIKHFRGGNNGNSPLTWHINHDRLFDFATGLMGNKPGDFVQLLAGLYGYSSLNMNFKSDALMFSGSSTSGVGTTNYLSLYLEQHPIEQTLKRGFPANTATYISFGISDFPLLHRGVVDLLTKRKVISQMQEQHRLIQNTAGVSIQEDLLPEWGNEFAVLELSNRENLAIVKVKDSLSFANTIQRISTAYPENTYRLNHSNLLYYSFGDPLQAFTRPYFLLIDEYFVCANHTSTLQRFVADYNGQKTLEKTLGYIDFDALQANQANVAVFVNRENASRNIAQGLKRAYEKAYTDERDFGYQQFYAWSFQLSGASGGFFSNFYAKYANRKAPGVTPEWTVDLGGRLITDPTVLQYDNTSRFILAQASNNILHAISTNGQRLWNAQLPGPVLGRIHQLADSSIVLTTAKRLYRFDTEGNPLPGFSIQLPHEATYGATTYENGQDIRFFVPAGNRILAYDANAEILPGWENKTFVSSTLFDVKTAYVDGINYVIIATDGGRIYFFNYNGSLVRMVETEQDMEFQNPLGLNVLTDDPDASWVITTDTAGTVVITPFKQAPTYKTIGQWTASHTFDAVSITGNRIPELVFTNNGQLSVHRYQDSSLVYHYDFGQQLVGRPKFFRNANGTQQIGIATEQNGLIYLFNTDGTLVEGFPTEGAPNFYYGPLQNDGHKHLITSKENQKLNVYRY